jgi:DNA-binding FrmR family transcriptional regulator
MNLKAFKALQAESPRTAMIFDLTERFPRGPAAKLRSKHYTVDWGSTPKSAHLIGGELGYDIFELFKLCSTTWWIGDLEELSTRVEDAGMGRHHTYRDDNGEVKYTGARQLFKAGPQLTRRLRRLEERLRDVRRMMDKQNSRNLYDVRVGHDQHCFTIFGDSAEHAKMQYELLLKAGFEAAAEAGYIDRGWRAEGECNIDARFAGPAHGPHEIMERNQEYCDQVMKNIERMQEQIEKLQKKISAAHDLHALVNMFTINSCAQEFGEQKS